MKINISDETDYDWFDSWDEHEKPNYKSLTR